jgi:hypothetical protein
MSEWGNPPDVDRLFDPFGDHPTGWRNRYSSTESIGLRERTRGTETSQYPEERKSTETPLVVASERGPGRVVHKGEAAGKLRDMGDSPVAVERTTVRVGRDT